MAKTDYTKLRELLNDQETFPIRYLHKFIGKNTPAFNLGVEAFERAFPSLTRQTVRMSAGDANVALTYAFDATSADEIIDVLIATEKIPDVLVML